MNQASAPSLFAYSKIRGASGEVRIVGEETRLPGRMCDVCNENEVHLKLARFDLVPPASVDRSILVDEYGGPVSFEAFAGIIEAFSLRPDDRCKLLPGTRIGHPVLRLATPPRDFMSLGILELLSERAINSLGSEGIRLIVTPVDVLGKKERHRYFNILTPVDTLIDEDWMRLEKEQCFRCGQWNLRPGVRRPKVLNKRARIVKNRWPEGEPLIYSPDIGGTYYSHEFVEACKRANLTGFGFQEVFWA